MNDMPSSPATISSCENSSQLRRRPSIRFSTGSGSLSTSGDQTHLNA